MYKQQDFESKSRCPECARNGRDTSQDNLHNYGEGLGSHCFSCGFTIPSDEYKREVNKNLKSKGAISMVTQKDKDALVNKALTPEQVKEIEAKTSPTINVKYRGVPSSVYESLGVRWEGGGDTGQPISMYYPITVTEDGKPRVVGYKVRRHPKDFYSIGYVGKLGGFLNQSNAVADTLIIVGGEVDLASAIHGLEMDRYRKSYNVVSSPLGEDSTAMMIKLNYDWVNAHKKIVCALDNDEAGEKAFEKIKEVIDADKLFKANIALNDLNDYLKEGRGAEIANAIYWSPTPVKTFGIAGSGSIFGEIVKTIQTESIALPSFLSDLKPVFKGGIPLQEICTIAAASSVGKSAISNEIVLDWIMNSPHKLLVLTFEDTLGSFGAKIASRVSGHNILAMETSEEKMEVLNKYKSEIDKYLYTETGEDRFNIVEDIPEHLEDLKEAIVQSIKIHGSKIIIIDPISSILSDKSNEEQASFMKFLEMIKNKYACTILQTIHTRKGSSGQKDKGEGASFSEDDVRGSSTIIGTSTIVIMLSRDKMHSDDIERNTTKISVSKNRTYNRTGRDVAKIYYSPEHHTLFSYSYAEANGFFIGTTAEELKNILDKNQATEVIGKQTEDDVEVYNEF